MDQQIEQLVVSVRADTTGFAKDVAAMQSQLEGPLAQGAGRAGKLIDTALTKAITSGKLGFDDLKKVALTAMEQIAQSSLKALFNSGGDGGDSASGSGGLGAGLLSGLTTLISGLFGAPGRATGGPVSAGRGYLVGERGPELFVPSSAGRIEQLSRGGTQNVNVAIAIQTPTPSDPQVLRQSSRQVARAVRSSLTEQR